MSRHAAFLNGVMRTEEVGADELLLEKFANSRTKSRYSTELQ